MGSGFRTFASGETLTSSNVQNYLMDQSVMVFAGTAARGSAIASPESGMITYRTDGTADSGRQGFEFYNGTSWARLISPSGVVQVLSTAKTDTFSTSSNSYIDVTGLSVTITPSSASNKVLVIAQINAGLSNTADANAHFKLVGGNTASYLPATAGNRTLGQYTVRARAAVYEQGYWGMDNGVIQYLDSPATTSATTYKVQMVVIAGTGYVNRGGEDVDVSTISRLSSSITVVEVAA